MGASARERLKSSWAEGFQREVLPLLLSSEDDFAGMYSEIGRPNYSVGRQLGICLLQEMNNLSDQAALDALTFDARWQYALDVGDSDGYLSRRSLVEFRRRLVAHDPEMTLMRRVFERLSGKAIETLGLSTASQRLDSTLVVSNIRLAGLLELFRVTTRKFLKSLSPPHVAQVPEATRRWHEEAREGWFGLGMSTGQRRDKLSELLPLVHDLVAMFADVVPVNQSEPYQLLAQLFDEHCRVVPDDDDSGSNNGSGASGGGSKSGATSPRIVLSHKRGASLQSPHDPDAEYGHKGVGYKAHITETCGNEGQREIITDYEVHGNARSDVAKTQDVLERLRAANCQPQRLFADAGYSTGEQLVRLAAQGTELFAPVHRGKLSSSTWGRDSFQFDDQGLVVRCPVGHAPIDHRVQNPNGEGRHVHAYFDGDICRQCQHLERCPVRAPNHRKRGTPRRQTKGNFRLDISPALRARDQRFAEQKQRWWRQAYKIRAGVEATMSELKRAHGMARLRVRRLPQVHFAIVCKVIACNLKRWLQSMRSDTRRPHGTLSHLLCILWATLSLSRLIGLLHRCPQTVSCQSTTYAIGQHLLSA